MRKTGINVKVWMSWQGKALLWLARHTENWLGLPVDPDVVVQNIVDRHVWIRFPDGTKKRISDRYQGKRREPRPLD